MATRTLIFGAGWLGRQAARLLEAPLSTSDIADPAAVEAALERFRPERVLNAAGRTGRPNVDSLEGEPEATRRSNVEGPRILAEACSSRGVHVTHLSSGCLYTGDNEGRGFAEDDPPNFHGSLYARTKAEAEALLAPLDVLQLRLRLPISRVPHPRNLLTKLLGYARVVSVPNSITVLEDFWPAALALMDRRETGIWNLVNEGAERHDELLQLYRERVDGDHAFTVVAESELGLRAGRSNCILSTAKLRGAGLGLPPLEESLPALVDAYGAALRAAGADQ